VGTQPVLHWNSTLASIGVNRLIVWATVNLCVADEAPYICRDAPRWGVMFVVDGGRVVVRTPLGVQCAWAQTQL
jgi:hypothetical protein